MSRSPLWRIKNGDLKPVAKMSDAHLRAAIRAMERRRVVETYVSLVVEAKRRGLEEAFANV